MGTAAPIIACHQAEDLTIRNGHIVIVNIHFDNTNNDYGNGYIHVPNVYMYVKLLSIILFRC